MSGVPTMLPTPPYPTTVIDLRVFTRLRASAKRPDRSNSVSGIASWISVVATHAMPSHHHRPSGENAPTMVRSMRRRRSASAQLEPLLGLLLALGAGRPGDLLSERLGAAGDGALRVGEDKDLAADGGLVGLGAVEVDLDRELLLER